MAIHYNTANRTFTLSTKRTTYQMKVDSYKVLVHTYYGERTGEDDMSYLLDYQDCGFSGNPYEAGNERSYSLDTLPQEYTSGGTGDYRINSVAVVNPDGTGMAGFRYVSHQIRKGKYRIPQLPAFYGTEEDADTLVIRMRDAASGLAADLYYSVWEEMDLITRCVCLENEGTEPIFLTKASSLCLDLMFGEWDLLHFYGRHCLERMAERVPVIHGRVEISSVRGASSHHHNPFVLLCGKETSEDVGPCYGVGLVYSGNFSIQAERDQLGQTRLLAGINGERFSWKLDPGTSFYTPEAVLTFSAQGFGRISSNLHQAIRSHLCRGTFQFRERPVLINNWEATYFHFDKEKILKLAKTAAELGVELFVLDDGWFGTRNDDCGGLGDWYVNEEKLPGGLKPLADAINQLGMQFGIWMEPEGISEDSQLYQLHPEWVLAAPGRQPGRARHQLVLNLSREDVREYLYQNITQTLDSAHITYVKWDMNRHISDVYNALLPKDQQGEVSHRYMLGLYELLERLVSRYPNILWEGCSGGGGRFDLGMLYYFPQIWCSDDTDAAERVKIQYGTSFAYPISTVGSHVSAVPNHQTGRVTSLGGRAVVAMAGSFGYEMDLNLLTEDEKEQVREQIKTFKQYRSLIHNGAYFRLTDPFANRYYAAWEYAASDGSEALVHGVQLLAQPNGPAQHIGIKGLNPDRFYEVFVEPEGQKDASRLILKCLGRTLMKGGLNLPRQMGDCVPFAFYIKEV